MRTVTKVGWIKQKDSNIKGYVVHVDEEAKNAWFIFVGAEYVNDLPLYIPSYKPGKFPKTIFVNDVELVVTGYARVLNLGLVAYEDPN